MSSAAPSATRAITSPVEGFRLSNVLPEAAGTHLPSMRSGLAFPSRKAGVGGQLAMGVIGILSISIL